MGAGATATAQGFRPSFRDWASGRTGFAPGVAAMTLAHAIPSAVEAACRRGTQLEKRRELMAAWGASCAVRGATVVRLGVG
jgi:hypothetical protein